MRSLLTSCCVFTCLCAIAQEPDSAYHELPQATVRISTTSRLRLLTTESHLDREALDRFPSYSLVSAVNSLPGVRMEERSPGSYRLSVRGSLLRSPFGIRNIKIYLGDFPFTDAGGNTYLQSLDPSVLQGIRILKGPESSLFGANIGGVLLIDPVLRSSDTLDVRAAVSGGSYGLFQESASFRRQWKKAAFSFSQGYQRSDGYRRNSALQRQYIQLAGDWNYSTRATLTLLALFSDLDYRTPGGLTQQQFDDDPRQARPATVTLPGAEEQQAGIHNRTLFAGISHHYRISARWKHVLSVSGSATDFRNPFITNYEHRREQTAGARTYVSYSLPAPNISLKWDLGGEAQQTWSLVENFDNVQGNKAGLQASDNLRAQQAFAFTRLLADFRSTWMLEASVSYNFFSYSFRTNYPADTSIFTLCRFAPQWMPRVAFSWTFSPLISWRASVSGGYSAPTLAEIRSSNNVVNTQLEAEKGISYETGIRFRDAKDRLQLDVCAFYFALEQAIVRRMDSTGNEYFINAGGTRQPGLEAQLSFWAIRPRNHSWIRSLQLGASFTWYAFTFDDYRMPEGDYSGNQLTSVPDRMTSVSIRIAFPQDLSLFAFYNYVSGLPLNDASTAFAREYHLVQLRAEWKKTFAGQEWTLFAGADNLLNQRYSLGNDLNAVGGRYFNAAPPRNYYGGVRMSL